MIRVGITGQQGFVGSHLYNWLGLSPECFQRIPFEDSYFGTPDALRDFVRQCDVIVHLAAMNRDPDPEVIYRTNIGLVRQLVAAMEAEQVKPYLLFSSSIQEETDNLYGRSKREGREYLESWAEKAGASFTGLVIPNVYGPFGQPYYNSFVATFCHRLTHGESPEVMTDSWVRLIYIDNLCSYILNKIRTVAVAETPVVERVEVPWDLERQVSEILRMLTGYKTCYFDQGFIPVLKDRNEVNLFNTFRSYIDQATCFPRQLTLHQDERGIFVETIRLGVGGQVSFSTTLPGITRGDHFHTRKIERFTVIRGKALIRLRKIGTGEVLNFELDGTSPSYVDMPVWYTHCITNTGTEELYTQFWINEWYDPQDADTYFEKV